MKDGRSNDISQWPQRHIQIGMYEEGHRRLDGRNKDNPDWRNPEKQHQGRHEPGAKGKVNRVKAVGRRPVDVAWRVMDSVCRPEQAVMKKPVAPVEKKSETTKK